jgi:superfamily II DNA or RNA helicase
MSLVNYYDIELNETSNITEQNNKLKIKLKPHQLAALNKALEMEIHGTIRYKISNTTKLLSIMNMLYSNIPYSLLTEVKNNIIHISTNVGIFGDMVGYGKTLIALALISINDVENIHINNTYSKTFNNYKNYSYLNISSVNNLIVSSNIIFNTTLVIVPRGPVYIQWENMIKTNTSLNVLSIENLTFIKKNLPKFTGNNRQEIIDYFNKYDLVLIKNTTLKSLYNYYYHDNNFNIINNWRRVIIDEAHDIINQLKVHINYNYLWMISGTYEDLLKKVYNTNNSLIYTNTAKELMNDEFINLMLIKNNNNFIKNSFKIPEPIEKYYLCKLPNNINVIKNFITDSILDKINANDITGAIKELGGKNENENDIIDLVSKELKRELFNKEAERDYITNLDILPEQKATKLKAINIEIENQEEKIKNLTERISYISSKTCSICMELITNPILIECTHIFCGGCLIKWLKNNNNCPYCRATINSTDKLIAIDNNSNNNNNNQIENNNEILSKEDTLLKIIKEKPEGRFLIFSKNENSFEKIKTELNKNNKTFELLKGTTSHMINVLDKFKSGEINIILLNTQYAGSGIDISCASDVIIFHNMGIDKQQAIGRAQRVGRKDELYIHNLYYEHEF